jgi:hypothetical protein
MRAIAKNRAYQQAVPATARSTCSPILLVRSDDGPFRRTTGTMKRKQIRFWNSSRTPVEVYWPETLASAPTSATQKNAAVVRAAANTRFSGR